MNHSSLKISTFCCFVTLAIDITHLSGQVRNFEFSGIAFEIVHNNSSDILTKLSSCSTMVLLLPVWSILYPRDTHSQRRCITVVVVAKVH